MACGFANINAGRPRWSDIAWNSFFSSSGTTLRMSLISGLSKFPVFAASKSENETRYLIQHHHLGGGFTRRPSRCVITGQSVYRMQFVRRCIWPPKTYHKTQNIDQHQNNSLQIMPRL